MKILIFSDTHFHRNLEPKKLKFLKKIVESVDKVIIAGDFWEARLMNFDEFIESPWKELFPFLKKKGAVYVYGNHDRKHLSDKNTSLFSDLQTEQYKFKWRNKTIVVEHGNRFAEKLNKITSTNFGRFLITNKITIKLIHTLVEKMMVRTFGNFFLQKAYGRFNREIKKGIKNEFKSEEIYICGHTHLADFDLKNNYVNTGIIRHGLAQYIIIDQEKITPYEVWYDK